MAEAVRHRSGQNVLIVGQPGAGKTTLARQLVRIAERCLVIDPVAEFDPPDAIVTETLDDAAGAILELRDEPARVVFRPTRDPTIESEHLLRVVELVQAEGTSAMLGVVLDEASLVSDTWDILPQLRRLYNLGRRWGVCLCTIAQVDTDVHRLTRRNAQLVVGMAQLETSGALRRLFGGELAALAPCRPPQLPQLGVHYLTAPARVDVLEWWDGLVGWGRAIEARESP